jgi:hypothetical protein
MESVFVKKYYIDIDAIIENCEIIDSNIENIDENDLIIDDESKNNNENGSTINVFKYEMIKLCIERVIHDGTEMADLNGLDSTKMSPSFLVAFNTLINSGIIVHNNE